MFNLYKLFKVCLAYLNIYNNVKKRPHFNIRHELVLKFGFGRFNTNPLHFLPAPELVLGFAATLARLR